MSRTKTLLTTFSILSVFLLGVLVFGIMQIRSQSQESSVLVNAADKTEGRDTLTQSIRSIQGSSMADVNKLNSLVLTEAKLVPFISFLENLGKSLDLDITTSSVSADKADDAKNSIKPTKVHVTIETDGSWASSAAFIKALENLPSHDTIDSTTLTHNDKSWHTSTSITLYSFKQ